ncbi:HNH endonuclease [Hymenobacter lapidiphilus]|uniref:HNH endonuclease signature motif containing protein n=1 Tax=Hymenobacter sp. CCM 8763 TaxID=2303334 RepID=UPI000E3416E2|nr:HNH endonuclease signature motif containing protein [Hymenobacter sp. CCM 8763]RFP65404.1 HNH endonuclease [Hymenobacter sp. CCM 8763]
MANTRKCLSTDDEFRQAVAESLSVRQVLSRIGLVPAGGNYKTVHTRVARLGLDTSHWTGAGWNQGERFQKFGKSTLLTDILVENSEYHSTYGLKNRLLKALLKERQCEVCNLTEWNGQPIPLELHHLNGTNNDHRLENLQLLCPNCHAQISNYRGKNQAKIVAN